MGKFFAGLLFAFAGCAGINSAFALSSGSGVIIGIDGFVLTSAHVVARCRSIVVRGYDQSVHLARVIARDSDSDIAALRLNAVLGPPQSLTLRTPEVGEALKILSFSRGVSRGGRAEATSGVAARWVDGTPAAVRAVLQPGMSGGAIMDINGRILGVIHGRWSLDRSLNVYIDAGKIRAFLQRSGISHRVDGRSDAYNPIEATVRIECL